jgi:hypothetical protein
MRDLGLMERLVQRAPGKYVSFVVTRRGDEISQLLDAVEHEYCEIGIERRGGTPPRISQKKSK